MTDTYTPVLTDQQIREIRDATLAPLFARAIERAAIEAYQRQQWISVEDRLPQNEETVLVLAPGDPYQKVALDCWRMQRESLSWSFATIETGMAWDDHEFEEVTHWMPLPPAPDLPTAVVDNPLENPMTDLRQQGLERVEKTLSGDEP